MNALRLLRGSAVFALLCALAFTPARAADQRDDAFLSSFDRGALDINDLYVFRSPANANNTVLIMTLGSFVGVKTKPVFKPNVSYEFRIDLNTDGATDLIFRIVFGKPGNGGVQRVTVTRTRGFDGIETLAKGKTGTNLPVIGGGQFRAAIFDDPFFFDQFAFNSFLIRGLPGFPRTLATAKNFYGPNANVLGIVLEIPSVSIAPNTTVIGFWARTALRGQQIDRCGRPFINEMLIPPVPRTDSSLGDKRRSFNRGVPFNDRTNFGDSVVQVFDEGIYHRTGPDSTALKDFFLPDQLVFQIGNPNGYGTFVGASFLGNGRRIVDDTFDTNVNLFTNGAVTTDNVKDDNGLKVTDGSVDPVSGQTRAIAFPYIGAPNNPPGGPNP
jgi:hypothetical protein